MDSQVNSQDNVSASVQESAQPQAAPANTDASALNTDGSPVVNEWKPDFKFKVMDKEHEIDPLFQPLAKDEETLKKIRRLHEQAYGIPHLEASRDEFKNKYSQVLPRVQEYEQVEKKLDKLSYFVQNQDFGSFFNELQIPKDAVLHWVKKELDMMEAPPEYRAAQEKASELARQKYDYEQELNYYRAQAQEAKNKEVFGYIDNSINGLAGDIASQYNERLGNPEAFRQAVIHKGMTIQQATGQMLPAEEVVSLVKQDMVRLMGLQENVAPQVMGSAQASAPQPKAPVIPVIKAGGASPIKTPPKSLEEIKKLANQL